MPKQTTLTNKTTACLPSNTASPTSVTVLQPQNN